MAFWYSDFLFSIAHTFSPSQTREPTSPRLIMQRLNKIRDGLLGEDKTCTTQRLCRPTLPMLQDKYQWSLAKKKAIPVFCWVLFSNRKQLLDDQTPQQKK